MPTKTINDLTNTANILDGDELAFWSLANSRTDKITYLNLKADILGTASDTEILFMFGTNIAGDPRITYNNSTNTLTVPNITINNAGAGADPVISSNDATKILSIDGGVDMSANDILDVNDVQSDRFTFANDLDTFIESPSPNQIDFITNNASRIQITNSAFRPTTDDIINFGTGTQRWNFGFFKDISTGTNLTDIFNFRVWDGDSHNIWMTATAVMTTPTVVLKKPVGGGTLAIDSSNSIVTDSLTMQGDIVMSANNINNVSNIQFAQTGGVLRTNVTDADTLAFRVHDLTSFQTWMLATNVVTVPTVVLSKPGGGTLTIASSTSITTDILTIVNDGTAGAPALQIGTETDGFFRSGVNELSISLNNLQEYIFGVTTFTLPDLAAGTTMGGTVLSVVGHTHAATDVISGTFDDARIAESNVTQFEAALTILETQITDGSVLARLADNETIAGNWTFTNAIVITADGTAAAPAIQIGTETDGFYRSAVNNIGVSINNINTVQFTVAGIQLDAHDIVTDTGTGMKIATNTAQKLGFFDSTPIIQQNTVSQTPATFVANSSGIVDDTATWGSYTIGDIVAILKAFGFIA